MVEKSILELQKDVKELKDAGKSRNETEELSTKPIALSRRMKAFRKNSRPAKVARILINNITWVFEVFFKQTQKNLKQTLKIE